VALTDHDTTAGLAEAMAAGRKFGIEVLAGVEISAFWEGVPVHILGYGIDPENAELQACLAELQAIRRRRNRGIQERLAARGIEISDAELAAAAPGLIGRPHFARILEARGVVADEEEAFRRFLRRNGAAYVPKEPFAACRAIGAILAAGGLAVLAHPHTCPTARDRLETMVRELAACGLGGLELRYPGMPDATRRRLERLAAAFSLAATGGSDYHGGEHHHPLAGCQPDGSPNGFPNGSPNGFPNGSPNGFPNGVTVPYRFLVEIKRRLGRS